MKKLSFTAEEIDIKLGKVEEATIKANEAALKAQEITKVAQDLVACQLSVETNKTNIEKTTTDYNATKEEFSVAKNNIAAMESLLNTSNETLKTVNDTVDLIKLALGTINLKKDTAGEIIGASVNFIDILKESLASIEKTIQSVEIISNTAKTTAEATATLFNTFYTNKDDGTKSEFSIFKEMVNEHNKSLLATEQSINTVTNLVNSIKTISDNQVNIINEHTKLLNSQGKLIENVSTVASNAKAFIDTHKDVIENGISATEVTTKINEEHVKIMAEVATENQKLVQATNDATQAASRATTAAAEATDAVSTIGSTVADQMEIAFGRDGDATTNANVKAIRNLANEAKQQAIRAEGAAQEGKTAAQSAQEATNNIKQVTDDLKNKTLPELNTQINAAKSATDTLKQKVQEDISKINTDFNNLNDSIISTQTIINNITNNLEGDGTEANPGILATVENAQAVINAAKKDMDTIKSDISTLTSNLGEKQKWIEEAEKKLQEAANKINTLDSNFVNTDKKITEAEAALNNAKIEANTLIEAANNKIADLDKLIKEKETTINNKLTEVDGKLLAANNSVIEANNKIQTLETSTQAAEGTITTLSSKIDTVNTKTIPEIDVKITTLNKVSTDLDTKINTTKTELDEKLILANENISHAKAAADGASDRAQQSGEAADAAYEAANNAKAAADGAAAQAQASEAAAIAAQEAADQANAAKDVLVEALTFIDTYLGAEVGACNYCYCSRPYLKQIGTEPNSPKKYVKGYAEETSSFFELIENSKPKFKCYVSASRMPVEKVANTPETIVAGSPVSFPSKLRGAEAKKADNSIAFKFSNDGHLIIIFEKNSSTFSTASWDNLPEITLSGSEYIIKYTASNDETIFLTFGWNGTLLTLDEDSLQLYDHTDLVVTFAKIYIYQEVSSLIDAGKATIVLATNKPSSKQETRSESHLNIVSDMLEANSKACYYWIKFKDGIEIKDTDYGRDVVINLNGNTYLPLLRYFITEPGSGLRGRLSALELLLTEYKLVPLDSLLAFYTASGLEYDAIPSLAFLGRSLVNTTQLEVKNKNTETKYTSLLGKQQKVGKHLDWEVNKKSDWSKIFIVNPQFKDDTNLQ